MPGAVAKYFSEFKVLKRVSRDFWLANAIQFFDCMAYFSMINVLTLYLTANCGFSDVDSGAWVGIYTLYVTAFMFAVGPICDVVGIKKAFFMGIGLLAVSRLGLGVVPAMIHGTPLVWTVKSFIILLSLGTAFMSPVSMTALRRFTSAETRATGFNIYYLIINVAAIVAGFAVTDGARYLLGEVHGNLAIFGFGFAMSAASLLCTMALNENNYADENERITHEQTRRPIAIFMEVWKEAPFRKLFLFLLLTIGVRLVFTHQFLVMPKYYTRVLYTDFALGAANSINPCIIVIGLILLIPVIKRFSTLKLIVIGMGISASSLFIMAAPSSWILALPGIHSVNAAYKFVIVAQIVVFAVGELLFSPRFTEYVASAAPKDKVSSYMALSALPTFIAKPINGFVSGLLISRLCYEGIRAKIDTGNISYTHSPEFMWMIYLLPALLSPIAVLAFRKAIIHTPEAGPIAPTVPEEDPAEIAPGEPA